MFFFRCICSIFYIFIAAQRAKSNIPPPLPAKPKQSVYAQISGESGTYVQPQLILPPSYRQPLPPMQVASPIKTYGSTDTVAAVKLQYSNQSIPNSFEHQKHPSFLSKLVR